MAKAGFEPVPGWECLYIHRLLCMFLTVYVGDFHMAGRKHDLPEAWQALRGAGLDLESSQPFNGNTYLGCQQYHTPTSQPLRQAKHKTWETIANTKTFVFVDETMLPSSLRANKTSAAAISTQRDGASVAGPQDNEEPIASHQCNGE